MVSASKDEALTTNKMIPSAGIKKAHHVSSWEHDVPFYLCNNQQIPHTTLWIFRPAPVC